MAAIERYVWAEINLSAINNNITRLKSLCAPGVKYCATIKANGYGLGAAAIAKEALSVGADYLAVAVYSEAAELRALGFTAPILLLGHVLPEQSSMVVSKHIAQTVYTIEQAQALSRAALDLGLTATVHVKVDSGMSRLGVRPEDAAEFCAAVAKLPGIYLEGVFTHFATADSDGEDKEFANVQFAAFQKALEAIRGLGLTIPIRHCCNSAATMDMPHAHLDMVRPGIASYGFSPWGNRLTERADRWPIPLEPAMQLKGRLSFVKPLPKGSKVGYGITFTAPRDMVLGTIPIGYADGYPRGLSGKASVLIAGRRAPLAGRVCMDQCMVDLSQVPNARIGDEVTLFGDGLPLDEVAAWNGGILHEIMSTISWRVPREYVRN